MLEIAMNDESKIEDRILMTLLDMKQQLLTKDYLIKQCKNFENFHMPRLIAIELNG